MKKLLTSLSIMAFVSFQASALTDVEQAQFLGNGDNNNWSNNANWSTSNWETGHPRVLPSEIDNNTIVTINNNKKALVDVDDVTFMELRFSGGSGTSVLDMNGKTLSHDLSMSETVNTRIYLLKSVQGDLTGNYYIQNGTLISSNAKYGYVNFYMGTYAGASPNFYFGDGSGTADTLYVAKDASFQVVGGNSTNGGTPVFNVNSDAIITSNKNILLGYDSSDANNTIKNINSAYVKNNSITVNISGKVGTHTYKDGETNVTSTTSAIKSQSHVETNVYDGGSLSSTTADFKGAVNNYGRISTTGDLAISNSFYVGDTGQLSVGGLLKSTQGDFTIAGTETGKVTSIAKTVNINTDGYIDISGVFATQVFKVNGAGGNKANGGYTTAVISGSIISAGSNFGKLALGDDASKFATVVPTYEMEFANGNFTVTSTAKLYASVLYVKGNNTVVTMQAKFYDDKANVTGGGISIRDNSTLVLDAIDVKYDTTHARQYDLGTLGGQNATIDVRKSNRIKFIGFADNKQTLTIDLTNGVAEEGRALVEFDQLTKVGVDIAAVKTNTVALAEGNIIDFKGFENGLVWFSKDYVESEVWRDEFRFVTFDGVAIDDESLYYGEGSLGGTGWEWIEKNINGRDGYLFTLEQVPEPAEWALIFGAIALGFIAYRRRK